MLYQQAPFDFSRDVLVIVHIPKTGGTALSKFIIDHFGPENCLRGIDIGVEKVGKIQPSRASKLRWRAREQAQKLAMLLRGGDPRLKQFYSKAELENVRAISGHFPLGAEPKISRKPVYVTAVREPVDRFLSTYYMGQDHRASWPPGKRDRHPFWGYDLDRFVDYVYARRQWNDINLQCRFLGGAGRFETARRAVDDRVFLAAPTDRLDEGLELLRPVLDLQTTILPPANVGKTRQRGAPPSPETLAKIRAMTAEDQLLYDYVSRVFDDLYREVTSRRVA
jgi:hypothetical protein